MKNFFTCDSFFKSLFGHESIRNMYMYTWQLNGARGGISRSFRCADIERIKNSIKLSKGDLYFGLAVRHYPVKPNERTSADGFDAITALWVDIDFASPFRHKQDLPPDRASIQSALDSMPPATWEIDSGYGLHMYWVLDEPFIARTQSDRDTMRLTIKRWNHAFINKLKALGYNMDTTSAAQVLRVPDSINIKDIDHPRQVQVLVAEPDETHCFDDLFDLCSVLAGDVQLDDEGVSADFSFTMNRNAELSEEELALMEDSFPKWKNIWNGKTKYASQSERDLAVCSFVRAMGWSDQKCCDAILQCRRIHNAKQSKGNDYIKRTLLKSSQSEVVAMAGAKLVPDMNSRGVIVTTEPEEVVQELQVEEEVQDMEHETSSLIMGILGIYIEKLVKIPSTPPSYRLTFKANEESHTLVFESVAELTEQKKFGLRIMEALDIFVPKLPKKKWDEAMTLLLPMAEIAETSMAISASGEFRYKMNAFLNARNLVEVEEGAESVQYDYFFIRKGKRVLIYITPMSFTSWHNREGYSDKINLQIACVRMFDIGGKMRKLGHKEFVIFEGVDYGGEQGIQLP